MSEGGSFGSASEESRGSGVDASDMGSSTGGPDGGASVLRPGGPVRHVGAQSGGAGGDVSGGLRGQTPASPVTADADNFSIEHDVRDPLEDKRAERRVAMTFLVSTAATVAFIVCYIVLKIHTDTYGAALNYALGGTLAIALFALGAGLVLWAKTLITKEYAVQDRHDGASPERERRALEEEFLGGAERLGIARRPLLRRTMLLAAGVLPLPALVLLRDLGPAPEKQLRRTAWAKGKRLVDVESKQPIKIGDLQVGAILTVMPEGFDKLPEEETALSPTILIRMRPIEVRKPTVANWTVDGHIAYSKVCTHAGCPTSLYEQQTKHLLCPCHQSTFLASEGCKVIFGPAARPLPQLPISVDDEGYFIAGSDYSQPVGPSFWERG